MNCTLQRFLAAAMLILVFPLLLLIALGCWISCGVALYSCTRIGYRKKHFTLYKFKTMQGDKLILETAEQQREWKLFGKLRKDPRVTGFGVLLRRFSLDELPQLWNVVLGDMALVGPRPIIDAEDAIYGRYSDRIHSVMPGITGLWQVSGRNTLTYRRRIVINNYYVRNRSLRLDLWIIWRTVWAVIGGRGAF